MSDPGDVAVRADEDGRRSLDRSEHRELPAAVVGRVNHSDPVVSWGDVQAGGGPEIEQDWPGLMEQLEYS